MKAANIAGTCAAVFVCAWMLAAGGKPRPAPTPEPQPDAVALQRDAVVCVQPTQLALAASSQHVAERMLKRGDCMRVASGERHVVTQWGIDVVRLRPEQGFFEYWAPRGAVE